MHPRKYFSTFKESGAEKSCTEIPDVNRESLAEKRTYLFIGSNFYLVLTVTNLVPIWIHPKSYLPNFGLHINVGISSMAPPRIGRIK